ncbi:Ger(x)C family germination protein [Tumebacillus sp. BK434]|uniref:Ger(x)C family spore germination protein n=1 Tax=Tumebacillus sp. BK434 TaxID=2512169 RepID=UPI0010493225|nr:Ger(x)C family spore germination protein [Tumebacillus sp. BK434]TCP59211.1 Ger(x)C family germination protein [Tumebacillus sp. BK434]
MKNKRRVLVLLLLVMSLSLSGCWSYKTLEHLSYIHSIGIDYRDGKFFIYAQFPNFTLLSKVEGAGQSENATPIFVGKGVGETFNMALYDLYHTMQRRLFWSHLTTIVMTEATMKMEVDQILDLFQRFGEYRPTFWVYITDENLEDIFLSTHVFDSSPVFSKLGDPIDMNRQDSYPVLPQRMFRYMAMQREPAHTMIVPSLGSTKTRWFDENRKYRVMHFDGYTIFKNKKWKGRLSYDEAQGLLWLNPDLVRSPLTIKLNKKSVFTIVILKPDVKIIPILKPDRVQFALKIRLKGHVTQLSGVRDEKRLVEAAINQIKKQIRLTYNKGLEIDADVLNLSDSVYRKHPQAWKKFAKNNELPLQEDTLADVKVHLEVMHYGKKLHFDQK